MNSVKESSKHLPELSLHHGGIAVTDLKRSLEFYERVLGFEVDTQVKTPDGTMDIVHIKRGEDYLELFCHKSAAPLPEFARDNTTDFKVAGSKHVAFSTDDPEGMHKYLQEQKVDGLTPIFDNNPYYKYFFFRDPDGIALEVVAPLPRD